MEINIKTKFDVGDKVYFLLNEKYAIIECIITDIFIYFKSNNTTIEYLIQSEFFHDILVNETEVAKTKEELKQKLLQKYESEFLDRL